MGERAAWPRAAMLSPSPVSPLPHRGSAPTQATLGNIPVCQVLTHPRPLFPSPGPGDVSVRSCVWSRGALSFNPDLAPCTVFLSRWHQITRSPSHGFPCWLN